MTHNNHQSLLFWSAEVRERYSHIIVPIFLMLFITVSVLGGVFFLSNEVAKTHQAINYAGRQTTNIQNLKNSVYNIDLFTQELKASFATASGKERGQFLEEIRYELFLLVKSQADIDHAIQVFTHGGLAETESGMIKIAPLTTGELKIDIEKANEYWQPYKRLIDSFQRTLDSGAINSETIRFATDYARIFSDSLYYEFDDIGLRLRLKVDQLDFYMQLLMIAGLILAIGLFAYITLIAIRQLLLKDADLALARRETADIMRTVKEGLFLVYPDYKISHEYSSELSNIIRQHHIGGRTLQDLMANIVTKRDIETTEEFIEQLFNTKVVEDLIDDLNPLERIKVILNNDKGFASTCYLSFKFSRVYEGKKIARVLVSVRDVTDAVELEAKLEKERQQHDEELEMLASILHLDAAALADFIRHAQTSTDKINNILKDSSEEPAGEAALRDKVEQIFRTVHSLKGEASALKLENYVSLMQHFEKLLREMRESSSLTGNDFLPLVIDLEQLIEFNEKISALNASLREKSGEISIKPAAKFDATAFFSQFADDIAKRNDREVELTCQGFELIEGLPRPMQDLIKDLLIQFLRNAIVHGIEAPDQRESLGKTKAGHVQIRIEPKEDAHLSLVVQDDGRGINYHALREKAVESGAVSSSEAESLTDKDLVKFMLRPGVSTLREANEDAGQGVGSGIIVENIKALNGRLGVFSQSGTFTRFAVTFPKF